MYKLLVLVLAVLACDSAASFGTDRSENVSKAAAEECKLELNLISVDFLNEKGNIPTIEAQGCFWTCFFTKLGHLKDGKLDFVGIYNNFINMYGHNGHTEELADTIKIFKRCRSKVDKVSNEKCASGIMYRVCAINTINHPPPFLEYEREKLGFE